MTVCVFCIICKERVACYKFAPGGKSCSYASGIAGCLINRSHCKDSPLSLVPTGWTTYELPKAPKRKEHDVIQSHKTNPVYVTLRGLKGPHRVRPLGGLPSCADKRSPLRSDAFQ
ncbi:hypothetical protein AVEN_5083-1 [Araneus ventricosus]|uniref:Uncharacterized protein n=1 Tax=Araneus ventricosus TaxID=182803 RepID=A0A4Y2M1E9_ARAVE|nr:hypothetical protein AVEN_5083-1 [Araneus ventricosus]